MRDAIDDTMTITMDKQGRIVLPKLIRDEVGIQPGTPLRICARDGRIEIEPRYANVRIVERDGFAVAESVEPVPPLPESEFRRVKRELRERRKKW